MKSALTAMVLAAPLVGGCASVASGMVEYNGKRTHPGLQYSVPKALVSVELLAVGESVTITISEPFLEGDPSATYTLRAISGAFADQDYSFTVNSETRLLETVRSESYGRADDILVDAAGSFGGITTSSAPYVGERTQYAPRLVYHRVIDPMMQDDCGFGQACVMSTLSAELNDAAADYLNCDVTPMEGENLLCGTLRSGAPIFQIEMQPLFRPTGSGRASLASNKCGKAICYRVPVPYEIRLKVSGMTDVSQVVRLPNDAPVLSLSLPAGLFADAKSNVVLVDGMPVEVSTNKESELAVAVGVPLNIVDSFFASAAKISPLRIQYNDDKVAVLESQARLEEAQAQRAEMEAQRTQSSSDYSGYTSYTTSDGTNSSYVVSAPQTGTPTSTYAGSVVIERQEDKLFNVTISGANY